MNFLTSLRTLAIAAIALAPASGFAKNRGHHHNHSGHHGGHYSHGYHGGYYGSRPYCPPSAYRPYYARPYYGYGYYNRPAISVGFSTGPAYYGSGYYGGGYYGGPSYNTYTTRTIYRGAAVRESARYDDDLAVDVQRALSRRGFYRGGIDGDVGPSTRAAIRAYQYDRGLQVTGRIDNSLLRSLRLG